MTSGHPRNYTTLTDVTQGRVDGRETQRLTSVLVPSLFQPLFELHGLLDVELVTFKDVQTLEQANEGVSFLIEQIPVGDYQGIRLVIGLTPELNATQPSDYVAGDPLSDHYWSWALGYVFTKIEGNADLNGDGNFDEKLTYHIGHNDLAREKTFSGDITLEQGRTADIFFEVDALDVIRNQSTFIDFRITPQDHTNDMDLARFISDNLFNALIMK